MSPPAQRADSGFARYEGVRIAWESRGRGGRNFVLVPFLGVFGRLAPSVFPGLATVLDALAAEGRLTLYDPRGTGESTGPLKPTPADLAEDLQNAILAAEARPAWLIAHLDAAGAALYLAAERSDLVAGVLCDSVLPRLGQADNYNEGVPTAVALEWADAAATDATAAVAGLLERYYGVSREAAHSTLALACRGLDRERRQKLLGYFAQYDVRAQVSRSMVPALVVQGSENPLVPLSAARYLVTNLSNSQLAGFEGEGHFLLNTAPEKWLGAARDFMRRKSSFAA